MPNGALKMRPVRAGTTAIAAEQDRLRRGLWHAVILALPVWIAVGWLVLRQA